ncbi:MAG TPA: LCP family protein, partial [Mycobacteriales bacterium]|nr:LCP family protein [Mycobacteriales bacterium]
MTLFTILRRHLALAVVLLATLALVPPAAVRDAPVSLVKLRGASGVDHPRDVVWVLFLGSDARPGQSVTRSRADAIQLTGINLRTGAATVIGVPRDSYVSIPGHGRDKINSSMYLGGPQLMGRSVANLVGISPDYVFTTG